MTSTTKTPELSLPEAQGSSPAGASTPAGISSLSPGKHRAQVIIAATPLFYSRDQAGHLLGRSREWLRQNALLHDLYKPSVPGRGRGCVSLYHRDHINLIAEHMMNPEVFSEDAALAVWRKKRATVLRDHLHSGKEPRKRTHPK